MSSKVLLGIILVIAIFTRFYGISWGNGLFFHPDENNMATALSQLTPHNFNPHFFAYGQFPLYLGYFTLRLINIPNTFSTAILVLRFWSAFFSVISILVFYLIYPNLYFAFLLVFTPGLIQLAHFGTTESLLTLVFTINLYLAKKIIHTPSKSSFYFAAAISTGIGLASKISALIFIGPVLLAILFSLKKYKNILVPVLISLCTILAAILISLVLSPYNLIENQDFRSALNYETQVATGAIKVFYTQQFEHTVPFIFQLTKIFPYAIGIPIFALALIGLLVGIVKLKSVKIKYPLIIFISCVTYVVYFGQLYVKWTRFMSPVFFVFPLLAAYSLRHFPNKYLRNILFVIAIIPGVVFLRLYFSPDPRLQFSNWFDKNIPAESVIFSEAGNVINLPITQNNYLVNNFDFYNLNYDHLVSDISSSDYILVPSRRVFKNHFADKYYTNLFNDSLGFTQIYQLDPRTDILLNPENAEETWTVFDRPTIRVYKKMRQLTISEYETLIQP